MATIVCRCALVSALAWMPAAAAAQDNDERGVTLGGLLFGDLYHVASHHTDDGDGATGVVLRRGYLTLDAELPKTWFGRARLELNQSGKFETYTFEVDFKDLYVGVDLGRHRLIGGLTAPPTFDLIESIWGFRYLARTPMDLQGVPSRDTGISAQGPLSSSGKVGYRAMVGTGAEFGNESGDGEKFMAALAWRPAPRWVVDLYADFEQRPGPADRTTLQAFVGYESDSLRWGVQYSNQDRQEEPRLELASAFLVKRLGEALTLIGRVDRIIEPSPKGNNISYLPFDPSAPATMFIGGLEYRASRVLSITPNTVFTTYDRNDEGVRPRSDLHLRLTLFLDLE